jgi:hypothetical protein
MPLSQYKKDVNNLIKITAGSRKDDNNILSKLAIGELEYEDIINFYSQINFYQSS